MEEDLVRDLAPCVVIDIGYLNECNIWIVVVQTGITVEFRPDAAAVLGSADMMAPFLKPWI